MSLPEAYTGAIERVLVDDAELAKRPHTVQHYYSDQNSIVRRALSRYRQGAAWAVDLDSSEEDPSAGTDAVNAFVNAAFAINILLFVLKLIATAVSGSLAVISSAVDSALDLLSGSIIFATALVRRNRLPDKFPVGRSRLEPLSILVFASVMATTSLMILREGIEVIISGVDSPPQLNISDPWVFASLGAAVGLKLLLLVVAWMTDLDSPSVDALAQDSLNDVLTNTLALVAVAVQSEIPDLWWLDPTVSIVLALYILWSWVAEAREHVDTLSGRAASQKQVNDLIRIVASFDPRIRQVCTVRAYHVGVNLQVEVDIVLDPKMPLEEVHDIIQNLQVTLERLESVERAFVHPDVELESPDEEHIHPDAEQQDAGISEHVAKAAKLAAERCVHMLQPARDRPPDHAVSSKAADDDDDDDGGGGGGYKDDGGDNDDGDQQGQIDGSGGSTAGEVADPSESDDQVRPAATATEDNTGSASATTRDRSSEVPSDEGRGVQVVSHSTGTPRTPIEATPASASAI